MSNARILIVHPDASAIALMTSMLRTLGHRIDEAASDRVAVRMLEHVDSDLILAGSDPQDPESLEFLNCLRRKHPHIPVVVVLPCVHAERTREALQRGAVAVIRYPMSATQLRAAVSQALGLPEEPLALKANSQSSLGGMLGGKLGQSLAANDQQKPLNGHSKAMDGIPANGFNTRFSAIGQTFATPGDSAPSSSWEQRLPLDRIEETPSIVGEDPIFRQAVEMAETIAVKRFPVLIAGEPGTGKSLLAQILHKRSSRREAPLIEVSCGSRREAAANLEVELFGKKGSFGGTGDRVGKLAMAHGGTLYLDEVAALSPDLQHKLLRVILEGEFEPVGSAQTMRVDVRIVLGTREDLEGLVEEGLFRQDLLYRISVVSLKLPPLRHRGSDIEKIAEYFLSRFVRENDRGVEGFSTEALDMLRKHDWPGNVHELENVVKRGVLECRGTRIDAANLSLAPREVRLSRLPSHTPRPHVAMGIRSLKEALEEPEKRIILQALEAHNWNRQETARVLDINRTTLYKKMKKYGLLVDAEETEPAWA